MSLIRLEIQLSATKSRTENNLMEQVAVKVQKKPNTSPEPDLHIIEGCQRNDRLSQKKFYEFFYGKMMGICLRYTNGSEEAKDILHEGFMKVFQNIGQFTPTASIEHWVKRIMINTAIDHYRRNKKTQNQVSIDYAVGEADEESYNSILDEFSSEDILKLVQKLSSAYRTVFNLFVIEGYSHREISEMLGISQGTTKSNLAKARQQLRDMIRNKLPEHQPYFND